MFLKRDEKLQYREDHRNVHDLHYAGMKNLMDISISYFNLCYAFSFFERSKTHPDSKWILSVYSGNSLNEFLKKLYKNHFDDRRAKYILSSYNLSYHRHHYNLDFFKLDDSFQTLLESALLGYPYAQLSCCKFKEDIFGWELKITDLDDPGAQHFRSVGLPHGSIKDLKLCEKAALNNHIQAMYKICGYYGSIIDDNDKYIHNYKQLIFWRGRILNIIESMSSRLFENLLNDSDTLEHCLKFHIGKSVFWDVYKSRLWGNEKNSLHREIATNLMNLYCNCVDVVQHVSLYVIWSFKSLLSKDVTKIIGQFLWESRDEEIWFIQGPGKN